MSKTQNQQRKEKQIQKFRDFGILTEPELDKIHEKEIWLMKYIKNHHYITTSNISGDFMLEQWNINLVGQSGSKISDIKRLLSYQFIPLIKKLNNEGVLLKHNSKTYKVVKNDM